MLLVAAIVSVGLMGGLFYGWTVSVIPGLKGVTDRNYIATMQSINVKIINPAFVLVFMGTPLILGASAVAEFRGGNERRAFVLAAAAATYIVGVLGVTVGGNIPLNDALDTFDLGAATDAAARERRQSYEGRWNRWHNLRTGANVMAFAIAASATIVTADAE